MKKRVAIQGIKASFHEEAAFKFFGQEIEVVECSSFKQTFETVKNHQADYLVMAIENSTVGSLMNNYKLLSDYCFPIIGEVYLPIKLHLLALPNVKIADIKQVISHPVAISQCFQFLEEHPEIQVVESSDTAACAKKIQEQQLKNTAAIANTLAASAYGLEILAKGIESSKKNFTRFLILTQEQTEIKAANKSSLSFQVPNSAGALVRVLNILAENQVNMSKIQSTPVVGHPNEYNFFVDVEWDNVETYTHALKKVLAHTINFNMMGEYKRGNV